MTLSRRYAVAPSTDWGLPRTVLDRAYMSRLLSRSPRRAVHCPRRGAVGERLRALPERDVVPTEGDRVRQSQAAAEPQQDVVQAESCELDAVAGQNAAECLERVGVGDDLAVDHRRRPA